MAYGITQLGYMGFEVKHLEAWERFSTQVLGLGISEREADGSLRLRLDSYKQRLFIREGALNDVSVFGWEVADEAALAEVSARLAARGVTLTPGSAEEAAYRNVQGLVKLEDPSGNPLELYFGAERHPEPFVSSVVQGGFVAEEQGLGHCVISARDKAEATDFYCELLGFRLSDHIRCTFHGHAVDLSFFHANARHHSLAFGGPQRKRIHHFMLEARHMDEVGLCFDRSLNAGVPIMQTLGRHPNDRMFSFYAKTPSGFQFEFGWGGRAVDDATWEPTEYQCISEWGHHPPMVFQPKPEAQR